MAPNLKHTRGPHLRSYLGHIWGQFGDRSKFSLGYVKIVEQFEDSVIDKREAALRIAYLFAREQRFLAVLLEHFSMENDVDLSQIDPKSSTSPVTPRTVNRTQNEVIFTYEEIASTIERHVFEWEAGYHLLLKKRLKRARTRKFPKDASVCSHNSTAVGNAQPQTQRLLKDAPSGSTGLPSNGILKLKLMLRSSKAPFDGLKTDPPPHASTESISISSIGSRKSNQVVESTRQINPIYYKDESVNVPHYNHHLRMHGNVLTENTKRLNYNPVEIQHEEPDWWDAYQDEVTDAYTHGTPWDRDFPLLQVELAKHFRRPVMEALKEIGCSVSDLLRYIVGPNPVTGAQSTPRQGLKLEKEWDHWAHLLANLPKSTDQSRELCANVCRACDKITGCNIFYIIRDLFPIKAKLSEEGRAIENMQSQATGAEDTTPPSETFVTKWCRVCRAHMCTEHGEWEEYHEEAERKLSRKVDRAPGSINYRLNILAPNARSVSPSTFPDSMNSDVAYVGPSKSYQHWCRTLKLHKDVDKKAALVNSSRGQFYPCTHEGSCDDASDCTCRILGINCEKSCGCAIACARRFTGCSCSRNGRICQWSEKCVCWQMERECDPDLCGRCGAADALDRMGSDENVVSKGRLCRNVSIQRGIMKRLLIGNSLVDGFGLYTGEPVKKYEFLGEYRGEVLSEPEADRRQVLHQHGREYLFIVNKDQQVDSKNVGSKIRFVNNSQMERNINCIPKPLLCNGVIRMALFAGQDLPIGVELFFKYGYTDNQVASFKELSESSETVKRVRSMPKQKDVKESRRSPTTSPITPRLMMATPAKRKRTRRVIDDSENSSMDTDDDDDDAHEGDKDREDEEGQEARAVEDDDAESVEYLGENLRPSTDTSDAEYMFNGTRIQREGNVVKKTGRKGGMAMLAMRQRNKAPRATRSAQAKP